MSVPPWIVYVPAICRAAPLATFATSSARSSTTPTAHLEFGLLLLVHDGHRAWLVPRTASDVNAFGKRLADGEVLPPAVWAAARKVLPNNGKMPVLPTSAARAPHPQGSGRLSSGYSVNRGRNDYMYGQNSGRTVGSAYDSGDESVLRELSAKRSEVEEFLQACCTSLPSVDGNDAGAEAFANMLSEDWWNSEDVRQFLGGGPRPEDESAFAREGAKLHSLVQFARQQVQLMAREQERQARSAADDDLNAAKDDEIDAQNEDPVISDLGGAHASFSARDLRTCELGASVVDVANVRWLEMKNINLPPPVLEMSIPFIISVARPRAAAAVDDQQSAATSSPSGRDDSEDIPLYELLKHVVQILDRFEAVRHAVASSIDRADYGALLDVVETLSAVPTTTDADFLGDAEKLCSAFDDIVRVLVGSFSRKNPTMYVYLAGALTHIATAVRWATSIRNNAANEASILLGNLQQSSSSSSEKASTSYNLEASLRSHARLSVHENQPSIEEELERLAVAIASGQTDKNVVDSLHALRERTLEAQKNVGTARPATVAARPSGPGGPGDRKARVAEIVRQIDSCLERVRVLSALPSSTIGGFLSNLTGTSDDGPVADLRRIIARTRSILESGRAPLQVAELLEECMFSLLALAENVSDFKGAKNLLESFKLMAQTCISCKTALNSSAQRIADAAADSSVVLRESDASLTQDEVDAALRRVEDVQENLAEFEYAFKAKHKLTEITSHGRAIDVARASHNAAQDDLFGL